MARPSDRRPATRPSPQPPGRAFTRTPLTRQHLADLVRRVLEPLRFVHALWEGGSVAFGRADTFSDADLQACVDDEKVAETFAAVEAELEKVLGIDTAFTVPEPTWHGHAQRFYRFADREPWIMLDLVVRRRSAPLNLMEREIHGNPPWIFDKIDLAAALPAADPEAHELKLRARIQALTTQMRLFAHLVEKECRRQRVLDAIHFYHSLVIAPLVELLRIRHDPWRHDFGMRYLHTTLPVDQARRLEDLLFIRNFPDLQAKQRVAVRWFDTLATELARAPRLTYSTGGITPPRRGNR